MYRVTVRARLARDPGWDHTLERDLAEAARELGYGGEAKADFDIAIRSVHAYLTFPADSLRDAVSRGLGDTSELLAKAGHEHALLSVSAETT